MSDSENIVDSQAPVELFMSLLDGELSFMTSSDDPTNVTIQDVEGNIWTVPSRDLKNIAETIYQFSFLY